MVLALFWVQQWTLTVEMWETFMFFIHQSLILLNVGEKRKKRLLFHLLLEGLYLVGVWVALSGLGGGLEAARF